MMSKKCKYAIKALSCLAKTRKRTINSKEIALNEAIPKKFLENILLTLKIHGYISSKKGNLGGYFMEKDPNEITIAEIYRLFDGRIALLPCVSERFYLPCEDCKEPDICKIKSIFTDFRTNTLQLMKNKTIQNLI